MLLSVLVFNHLLSLTRFSIFERTNISIAHTATSRRISATGLRPARFLINRRHLVRVYLQNRHTFRVHKDEGVLDIAKGPKSVHNGQDIDFEGSEDISST